MQEPTNRQEPTEEKPHDFKWPQFQAGDLLDIDGVHFVIQRINVSSIVIRPVAQRGLRPWRVIVRLRG